MTRTTTLTLAAVLCSTAAAAQTAQNPITFSTQGPGTPRPAPNTNPDAPLPPGTSTLTGHVFAADSGQPLRKAQVRIFAPEIRENRMATTDAEGRYEFKEVRGGRYTISASKGSYVGLSYGQARSTDAPKPLQILDNQNVERVDVSLPPGGIITGRIVDEYGEPMSDVQVGPQSYQSIQGQRRLVPSGRQASTNDIGEFRLFGIAPGQYYLSATWRPINAMNNEERTAYAPMYFPGTDNVAQARRLTVTAGQQISDVVMALKPMRATRISGTAMTSEGKPMTGGIMVMSSAGYGFSMAANGPIRPDGTFSVTGLAPGEYTLRAQSFGPAGPNGETAAMKLTVTGEDITDLQIIGAKPSTATGRVVVDPAIASSLPSTLMVTAMPVEFGPMMMGMSPGRMADDGTFELKSAPGKMRITLNGPVPGWTIRTVRLNGSDVTDTGIEFKPNEDISGLEVEITNKVTTITGLVTNARGETVKDYSAIAFAQDREKLKVIGRYQSTGRPDQDGRFKITGLAPTDYYIIALDKIDPTQISDPDFLDAIKAKATAITIREGETRTVDLKIASAS
jgi:protocatechuate 3,4-dioxygenase beta subunit